MSDEKKICPAEASNTCEHGDHPAPPNKRFCSEACAACELAEHPGGKAECAGICTASAPTTTCRRCSECTGENHHWIEHCEPPKVDDGIDTGFAGFVCKHCDARAEMCDDCTGVAEPGHVCEDEEDDSDPPQDSKPLSLTELEARGFKRHGRTIMVGGFAPGNEAPNARAVELRETPSLHDASGHTGVYACSWCDAESKDVATVPHREGCQLAAIVARYLDLAGQSGSPDRGGSP